MGVEKCKRPLGPRLPSLRNIKPKRKESERLKLEVCPSAKIGTGRGKRENRAKGALRFGAPLGDIIFSEKIEAKPRRRCASFGFVGKTTRFARERVDFGTPVWRKGRTSANRLPLGTVAAANRLTKRRYCAIFKSFLIDIGSRIKLSRRLKTMK